MTSTFTVFDVADHLKTDDDIANYLDAVTQDSDPALMIVALSNVARARNMSQLARDAGITREGLYKALSPDGNPSFATFTKIARAAGFQVVLRPIT